MSTTQALARTSAQATSANPYQQSIADYWDTESYDVNHKLGAVDNYFHHHYGIGEPDASVLDADEEAIVSELHRLENNQGAHLISHLGSLNAQHRAVDAGCGRGGTAFMLHSTTGCQVDGFTLSTAQATDARAQAHRLNVSDKVRFHIRSMLETELEAKTIHAAWNNESTMYVDLADQFAEMRRILVPGGRYVTITGCANDTYGRRSRDVSLINAQYACDIHYRSDYFRAMAKNRIVPVYVKNLTNATVPYWKLRAKTSLATGVEEPYLNAYTSGAFQYLLIVADRV
ncbi:SAM-dependent methyltransferase [Streptomyces sp. NPDC052236]|uniref:SAM-dependent methyltransferase n=1 Tax=Streptomyces sp. NPDC052236 TaxID=3365686 RepID=UPI0037D5E744